MSEGEALAPKDQPIVTSPGSPSRGSLTERPGIIFIGRELATQCFIIQHWARVSFSLACKDLGKQCLVNSLKDDQAVRDVWPQGGGVWLLRGAPLVAVSFFLQVNCPLAFLPNSSTNLTESANYSKDAAEL